MLRQLLQHVQQLLLHINLISQQHGMMGIIGLPTETNYTILLVRIMLLLDIIIVMELLDIGIIQRLLSHPEMLVHHILVFN
jgi:hypothetical protein